MTTSRRVLEQLDCVVIGGGVVGLAVARELSLRGRSVMLLEAEPRIGEHTSSRNSEVIHAGIYYPPGSLRARVCVEGKELLYRYAEERGVPHSRIGKLLVAVNEAEVATLSGIRDNAIACGVTDLRWVDAGELHELEPAVTAVRGLYSPSSGIIDSHALMVELRREAREHGAEVVTQSPVTSGVVLANGTGFELEVGGAEPMRLGCRTLVNSAGLWAPAVARSIRGIPPSSIPTEHFAKGHYFTLRGKSPFNRLVYPVPVPGGLGIHVTLDLAGQARFGPDVCWTDRIEYGFDESRVGAFEQAIRRYYPGLPPGALSPGHTGIRPKLSAKGEPARDFSVQTPGDHGVPGLVSLYGIESPGLTASLALARIVAQGLTES